MEIKKTTFGEMFGLIIILSMLNAAFAQGTLVGFQDVNAVAYGITALVIVLAIGYMFTRRFVNEFMRESKMAKVWDKIILVAFIFIGFSAIVTMFGIDIPIEAQSLMGLPMFLAIGLIAGTMMVEGGMYGFSKFLTKHKGALVVEELRQEAYESSKLGDTQRAKFLRGLAADYEKEERYLKDAEKAAIKLGRPEEVEKIRKLETETLEQAEIAATMGQMTEVEHEAGTGKATVEQAKKALETEELRIAQEAKLEEKELIEEEFIKRKEESIQLKTATTPRQKKHIEKQLKLEKEVEADLLKARKVQEGMEWLERELPKMEKKEFKEEEKAEQEAERRGEAKGKEFAEKMRKIQEKMRGGE